MRFNLEALSNKADSLVRSISLSEISTEEIDMLMGRVRPGTRYLRINLNSTQPADSSTRSDSKTCQEFYEDLKI